MYGRKERRRAEKLEGARMTGRVPNCYVYIVTNVNKRALYVGVTDDLRRSVHEHRNRLAGGFTAKYDVDKLVYFESSPDMKTAGERKKEIRKLEREEKNPAGRTWALKGSRMYRLGLIENRTSRALFENTTLCSVPVVTLLDLLYSIYPNH
jgi:putative endonuclease